MENPFFKSNFLNSIFKKKILLSHSKGIDKVSAEKAHEKNLLDFSEISNKCRNQTFKFSPYLELLKVKNRHSVPRMISIPTVRDKLVLLSLKEFLHVRFKERVNKRLPNTYLQAVKRFIDIHKTSSLYYLKVDINNFYGEIDHKVLLPFIDNKKVPKYILTLIIKSIENPTVPPNYSKKELTKYLNTKGVPQGLSISNILAEIYLTELDSEYAGKNYLYLRYVDDIFILMTTNRISHIEEGIVRKLSGLGLKLNNEKTKKGNLSINKVTFLGYDILGNTVSVSENNFHKIISKMANKLTWLRKCIAEPTYAPAWIKTTRRLREVFIEEINEKITGAKKERQFYGWMFYFIEMNDIDILFKLDSIVEEMMLKSKLFTKRPRKLKRFVRAYFEIKHNEGGNYLVNYNAIKTLRQKRMFLLRRGKIDPDVYYSDDYLQTIYDRVVKRNIDDLDKDINYKYL